MQVIWSTRAISSLVEIRAYINIHFSVKEEESFLQQVVDTLQFIKAFPKAFPACKNPKQARKAVIHPHTTLFYSLKSKKELSCCFSSTTVTTLKS